MENQIHHSPGAASHLLVPLIPDAPEIAPVGQPVRDIAWNFTPEQWSADTEGWPLEA